MSSVIVQNEMNVQGLRPRLIDPIEELTELYRPVTTMKLANNSTALDFERRKQRSGPVASIVVTASFALARPHRQHRLRTVQGLNLRLFVDRQNQGFSGRIEVQSYNVANLLNEQRILGKFEGFASVGSQSKGTPDAPYAGVAQPTGLGHRTGAPMRGIFRRRFQSHCQYLLYLPITEPQWRTQTRFIEQTIKAFVHKPAAPLPNRLHCQFKSNCHHRIARSICTRQNHSCTLRQSLSRLRPPSPALKSSLFFLRQHQWYKRSFFSRPRFLPTSFDEKGQPFIQWTLVPGH